MQETQEMWVQSDPWLGKIPWSKKQQPTQTFLPGEFHGQRSQWFTVHGVCKVLGTTEHTYNKKIISVLFVMVRCLRSYLFLVLCFSNFSFITMYTENRNEMQLSHTVISTAQYKSEPRVCTGASYMLYWHLLWECVNPGHHILDLSSRHQQDREGQGRSTVTEHSCIHS